ncbi:hypothetical protein PENANT_c019G05954 [Penicillium antarcticum]|uniref:Uncharacterized protein n=1 Tax=Penicillium antarcticum TaxID=416450 RepID=A0A1V6Q0S2_9EURO|nr:uncharacterized protein N7508_001106 [Penicillium antarcticum]KAJ5316598.1 hypothetical protein N7508_001106 [Penicillium antarcticum]OQD82825.1 hypothetical protein PENANT_c019G05954 [Penicillium antarcticum]
MLSVLFFLAFQVVLLAAWVSGTLDPYQKKLQELLLDCMGENKVSYGLKMSLTGKKLIEDENFSKIQDQLGNQLGGMFGKGGVGEGIGSIMSKSL